jgi:hypothetical protein
MMTWIFGIMLTWLFILTVEVWGLHRRLRRTQRQIDELEWVAIRRPR